MRRHTIATLTVAILATALALGPTTGGAQAPARIRDSGPSADLAAVIDWNAIARHAAIDVAGGTPSESLMHLGLVQAAAYDAVQAITGTHEPYGRGVPSYPDGDVDIAVAAAAHAVLVETFPEQREALDAAYGTWMNDHSSLVAIEYDPAVQHGIQAGTQAAAAVLALASQ